MKALRKIVLGIAMMFAATAGGLKRPSDTVSPNETIKKATSQEVEPETDFEKKYISQSLIYGEGGAFALSMMSNIGTIVGGVTFDAPTEIVSGVFGLLNSINDNFNSNSPSLTNVMNKLDEMDVKLNSLNEKLEANYHQIISEEIKTQAMVNHVLLEEEEQALVDFNTHYVLPMDDFKRNYSDYLEQSFKDYVSHSQDTQISLYQNQNNQWCFIPAVEQGKKEETKIKVSIDDFTEAKNFLEENYNAISVGFMDGFKADVKTALEKVNLPEGLDEETCCDYISADLVENFTKSYYQQNHGEALNLRNLVIDYAKQISGKNTRSIMENYCTRMESLYNFASEMKQPMTDLCASVMYSLDCNTALASQACLYAGISQKEIKDEYLAARSQLKAYYDKVESLDDHYCFVTQQKMTGGFYQAQFDTRYHNIGNNCTYNASFQLNKVILGIRPGPFYLKEKISDHNFVTAIDHQKIATRMLRMKQLGLLYTDNYLDYLKEAKIIPQKEFTIYQELKRQKCVGEEAKRLMTGVAIRDMNTSDTNFVLTCDENGCYGGNYFRYGWQGTYGSQEEQDCWSGKIAETTYVDATTGKVMKEKKLAAYANYDESHFYWVNDEHWSFTDNRKGNFFFLLENK